MAPVTVEILSLYSFAFKFPLLPLAFTMIKFDPAVVPAATLGIINFRWASFPPPLNTSLVADRVPTSSQDLMKLEAYGKIKENRIAWFGRRLKSALVQFIINWITC